MSQIAKKNGRREASLSRDQIITEAIAILDSEGENGLTIRALSERLETGSGAIYWRAGNKNELMVAACDRVISGIKGTRSAETEPRKSIRAFASGMFDAVDEHPWVGRALMLVPGQLPVLKILERLGQDIRRLGIPSNKHWAAASALFSYIIGVCGLNASNAQLARTQGLDRIEVLASMRQEWSKLDASEYPFARTITKQLLTHDDRADFLTGVDFIVEGIVASTKP